jgi:hypothetical protein
MESVPGLTNGKVGCNCVVMPPPPRVQIFSPFSCLPNIFPICQGGHRPHCPTPSGTKDIDTQTDAR